MKKRCVKQTEASQPPEKIQKVTCANGSGTDSYLSCSSDSDSESDGSYFMSESEGEI